MGELKFTEAFEKYGAKLANPQWAFSAIASDGSLVLSCWQHKITIKQGLWYYSDKLSRFPDGSPGRNLLESHLKLAQKGKLPIRLIIATTTDTDVVDAGGDASKLAKTFHLREDYIGHVVSFDGDAYHMEFKRSEKA